VSEGRKMFRRSIKVLTILLLATAAAAGAGDDIKWKRSKGLEFHSTEMDPFSFRHEKRELLEKCTMTWKPSSWSPDFAQISAVYFDWGLFHSNFRCITRKKRWTEVDLNSWRENFRQKYYFLVAISARSKPESRLSNRTVWEVVFEIDGQELAPGNIEPVEGGTSESTRRIEYRDAPSLSYEFHYSTNVYLVDVENPAPNKAPKNIKLILLGPECRGFEWRFKE
jgi:hypothetical protein